jgi:hypothetical protein
VSDELLTAWDALERTNGAVEALARGFGASLPQGFPHEPQTEAAETGTNRTDGAAERTAKGPAKP